MEPCEALSVSSTTASLVSFYAIITQVYIVCPRYPVHFLQSYPLRYTNSSLRHSVDYMVFHCIVSNVYTVFFLVEGQLKLLPPIRQDGRKSRKLYAAPNKLNPGILRSNSNVHSMNIIYIRTRLHGHSFKDWT